MPFDFPASPTTGQVFNAPTGQGYVYSGTAWNLAQTSPQAPVASDTPPANPYAGQLWLRSTTGALYMWYVDPNSSQWIQIPGSAAPVPVEEVLFNGPVASTLAWKLLNLSAYTIVEIFFDLYPVTTTGSLTLQVSTDNGATFDAGAASYYYEQLTGQGTTTAASGGNSSAIPLAFSNNIAVGANGAGDIGNLRMSNFNKAQWMHAILTASMQNSASALMTGTQLCGHGGTAARNALQIISAQNFTGRIFAKGIKG